MRKIIILIVVIATAVTTFAIWKVLRNDRQFYDDYTVYEEPETYEDEAPQAEPEYYKKESPQNEWPESVMVYEIDEEISSRLDKVQFDKNFVAFLQQEGLVAEQGYGNSGNMTGVLKVKDEGRLTIDFNSGALMFDLQIQDSGRPVVKCVICRGEYAFEVV